MPNAINDYLTRNGPRFGTEINQKMREMPTVWTSLYRQESWKEQESAVQKTFRFHRAAYESSTEGAVDWANASADTTNSPFYNGSNDVPNSIPYADSVTFKQDGLEYRLQHKAIWGPKMSVNDLRDAHVREKQMTAAAKALADVSREEWIRRKRGEFTRVSKVKAVLSSDFEAGFAADNYGFMTMPHPPTLTNATNPGSVITQGYLDSFYDYLNHQGAQKGALGNIDGSPVYGYVTSSRASRRIVTANSGKREDFRYAGRAAELLKPLGAKLQLNGWTHMTDDSLPRWNSYRTAAGGTNADGSETAAMAADATYTFAYGKAVTAALVTLSGTPTKSGVTYPVTIGSEFWYDIAGGSPVRCVVIALHADANKFYVMKDSAAGLVAPGSGGTSGKYFAAWIAVPRMTVVNSIVVPNPTYLTAEWEDNYPFHQDVACSLVPAPLTSTGGAKFDPVNYAGAFSWKNYESETLNPDGTIGRFRGVLMSGTRPENPEFGIVVRAKAFRNAYGAITVGTALD